MKSKLLLVGALASLLLVGCEVDNAEYSKVMHEKKEDVVQQEEKSEGVKKEINQVVLDNENLKATLLDIQLNDDGITGKQYKVSFEIENKRSDTIVVQARDVSSDGYMVDEMLLAMSDEIAAGKKGKAVLQINNYEGYDFPEMKELFEMVLHVFSWDDFEYGDDVKVEVKF